jgi:transcriptional regulator with XRE-family HTH domain
MDNFYVTILGVDFHDWLLKMQRERGWSPGDMQRETGLSRQALTNYLNGRIPNDKAMQKIARAFKIPVVEAYRAANRIPSVPLLDEKRQRIVDRLTNDPNWQDDDELEGLEAFIKE